MTAPTPHDGIELVVAHAIADNAHLPANEAAKNVVAAIRQALQGPDAKEAAEGLGMRLGNNESCGHTQDGLTCYEPAGHGGQHHDGVTGWTNREPEPLFRLPRQEGR